MQGEKVMPESSDKEIERLRNEWVNAQQSHRRWQSLIDKRDILEIKVRDLEGEIESLTLKAHQKHATHPKSAAQLMTEIESKKALLKNLKDKKRELDDLLDNLELITEDTIAELENRLMDEILKQNPGQRQALDEIQRGIKNVEAKQKALETTCQVYEKLEEHIRQVLDTRQDIKRRGILSYIFGPSPNWIISKQLQSAEALISSVLPKLQELSSSAASDEALLQGYKESLEFLEKLREDCTKRWGFAHLDVVIASAMSTLQSQLNSFKEHRKRMQNIAESYRTKLEILLSGG